MIFSKEVLFRAKDLERKLSTGLQSLPILAAISHLATAGEIIEDLREVKSSKLQKYIDIAAVLDANLKTWGISNDLDALLYISEMEPKCDMYLVKYMEMQQRHQQEIAELVASFD